MTRTLVRSITASSYRVYREYRLLRLALRSLATGEREPILVYQMGKVGSTAVAHALARALPARPIYHLHTLQRKRLDREEHVYRRHFPQRRTIDGHLLHSLHVRRRRAGLGPRPHRWKVVTLVRDPVQRNLSTFFQTLDLHQAERGFARRIRAGDDGVVDDVLHAFVETFPHERILTWFDDEIRTFFAVDLLEEPFPHSRGYRIHRTPGVEIVLLRQEDLAHHAPPALDELLDLVGVEIQRHNTGNRKYYADAYQAVKHRLTLPEPLLDRIYGSRMVRALYTPDEIARYRSRWSRGGS